MNYVKQYRGTVCDVLATDPFGPFALFHHSVFSSPEHKLLNVSYCGVSMSPSCVVWRQQLI